MTPRIAFWCGRALEPWGPPSINEGGIGGSETAVVHIARRFAQAGWKVDVFANPDHMEGVHDGVGYWDCKRLPRDAAYDVLVVWRDPNGHALPIQAPVRLAWLHDQHYGPDSGPDLARYDRVLGVSQHHADFLAHAYGLTNVDFVPNGIELERFDRTIQKEPFKCVWSSSPDRDLDLMLRLWPRITKVEPAATLHVAYGWQGVDFRIKMGDQEAVALKDRLQRTMDSTPGVTWYGRVGQAELAKMKCESWCSPYFTGFWEVSCISMMESMAAGAVPVCSSTGALKETVGNGGYVIPGNPFAAAPQDFFLRICHAVLGEANARVSRMHAGYARAETYTWDAAFDRWLRIVNASLNPAIAA